MEIRHMNRALLVIDVQNEYFDGKLPVTYPPGSFDNILTAMDNAAAKQIPIVIIQHINPNPEAVAFAKGSHGSALHPEIVRRSYDTLIEKTLPGSFTGTNLEEWLRSHGVDTITICGYMIQMCCDTTSRQAFHLGFNVEFLSDATGTLDFENYAGKVSAEELHRAILVTQAFRFSKVIDTKTWRSLL